MGNYIKCLFCLVFLSCFVLFIRFSRKMVHNLLIILFLFLYSGLRCPRTERFTFGVFNRVVRSKLCYFHISVLRE